MILIHTRRDWRWARIQTDAVDWPTNSEPGSDDLIGSWSVDEESDEKPDFTGLLDNWTDDQKLSTMAKKYGLRYDDIQIQPIKWNNIIATNIFH